VSEVSVRVEAVHTSLATEAIEVNVRELYDHIEAGSDAASDELAVATTELVLLLTAVVPAVIEAASDVEAFVTSDCTASDPDESPAPVRVRVAADHTSVATEASEVRVLAEYDQTDAGSDAASDDEAVATVAFVLAVPAAIETASEDEAFPTTVLVLLFTAVVIPDVCALVLLLTAVVTDDDAAVIAAAIDDDALPTMVLVLLLTAVVIPDVCALVFALITAASDEVAVVTSESVASDPEVRPAAVRVRFAESHTSSASDPSDERVREV
jgi:hypothetical protein